MTQRSRICCRFRTEMRHLPAPSTDGSLARCNAAQLRELRRLHELHTDTGGVVVAPINSNASCNGNCGSKVRPAVVKRASQWSECPYGWADRDKGIGCASSAPATDYFRAGCSAP